MIRSLKELSDFTVQTVDGEAGELEDFYFDDQDWVIRYLVVDASDWLDDRAILISPAAVEMPEPEKKYFYFRVKKDLIKESPAIDTERPLTRQQEIELYSHYDWPFYWGKLGPATYPLVEMVTEMREHNVDEVQVEQEDPHLQSLRAVSKYSIEARDGSIGQVEDLLVDSESWKIQYVVVDTGGWLTGRKVLISPQWIEQIRVSDSSVRVDLARETIKNSPEYEPSTSLDREYMERVNQHYGRDR